MGDGLDEPKGRNTCVDWDLGDLDPGSNICGLHALLVWIVLLGLEC